MNFQEKVKMLRAHHEELLTRKNEPMEWGNGIYDKWKNPILTAEHTPLEWRYDFNEQDNPYLMQRIMMNATFNSGAIKWNGKYLLVVRVEGADRKSFFAVAESPNGIDNFRFWEKPITIARHAYGDVYKDTEFRIEKPGKAELLFTSNDKFPII